MPKIDKHLIALDCETTGIDAFHTALPFFVTICNADGEQTWWEWPVSPLTRKPKVPPEDLDAIQDVIDDADEIVLQNGKFDAAMLTHLFAVYGRTLRWPWEKVHDTLVASHVLGSNLPHDLTALGIQYLGVNIEKYEKALGEACNEARRIVRSQFPTWRIASSELGEMPSAKSKTWKYDSWLPRALALKRYTNGYPHVDELWLRVLSDYANADSETTVALWPVMRAELDRRDLWEIYLAKLKVQPIVADMERHGVTVIGAHTQHLKTVYAAEAKARGAECLALAAFEDYQLDLPKGASPNNSLRHFCFEVLNLERRYGAKSKTAAPTLNKESLDYYEATLEPGPALTFVKTLRAKRRRDTYLIYLESYERFRLPLATAMVSANGPVDADALADIVQAARRRMGVADYFVLHPSYNSTGSDTLRFSSSNPNGQNVGKQEIEEESGAKHSLRYAFGPAPGREWWAFDYENIELRIPAYESGEQELIELFERPDEPPYYGSEHLLNFSTVYPDIWQDAVEKVGIDKAGPWCKETYKSTWYQRCKNGDFAVGYGAVDRADGLGTADRTFGRPGSHARLKSRFAKKETLNQRYIHFAERNGYVETLPDKTVNPNRGYPLLCTRTEYGRIKPTVPLNYHVQGTAMWCTIKAMIRVDAQLKQWTAADPRGYYMTLQVHDEIVVDFPKSGTVNKPKVERLRQLMIESGNDIGIPLRVAVSYHPVSWAEGVKV